MNDFQIIKSQLPLLPAILQMTGLSKKGPHLERCPLCDHSDCFSVMEEKSAWKCHSCGEGGDIFNLIQALENIDEKAALLRGAEMAGIPLSKKQLTKPNSRSLSAHEQIFEAAVRHYEDHRLDFGGREYFIEKRNHSKKTLTKMRAGFSTGNLGDTLIEQGFALKDLLDSGLVLKGRNGKDFYDYWPKGLAIFPVIDSEEKILTLTMKDPAKKLLYAVPKGTKKDWFLNHAALSKFSELIIVEGQNDGASLHDIGIDNWIGTAGQPSKDQIRLLKNFGTKKYYTLWFDRDPDKDFRKNEGGCGHTRKIYEALKDQEYHVKVLLYGKQANDPDEWIQTALKEGRDARRAFRALKDEAVDPLKWEIGLIATLPTRDERLKALESRDVFKEINLLSDMDQEAYIELLTRLDFSDEAVRKKLNVSLDLLQGISECTEKGGRFTKGIHLADLCFNWLESRGRFFRTTDGRVWLYYRHTIYEISDNLPFRTIMVKLTRLSIKEAPGKQMFDFLQTHCFDRGELIEVVSWIFTNRETDSIYVNLNSPKSEILRISPGMEPVAIPNGTNQEGVLLNSSPEIRPFEYQRGALLKEGFSALKKLIFDNLTCQEEMRYFVICWTISFLLVDFNKNRGLLHCVGETKSGKSTAASLISNLIFGQDTVGQSSAAASFSAGSHSPLVIQDNIENKDLSKQMVNFLLLAANSATKKKRKGGSDSDNVSERVNSMVIMTSIEPIPGSIPELVNRTFDVIFERRYQRPGFIENETSRELVKKRNLILSSIVKLISTGVLDQLDKQSLWLLYIQKEFPNHNKDRTNEFMSLLMVILEGILPFMPYGHDADQSFESQARDILKVWVEYQDSLADESSVTSNNILNLLDGLAKEVSSEMKHKAAETEIHSDYDEPVTVYQPKEYLIEFFKTVPRRATAMELMDEDPEEEGRMVSYLEFVATSGELYRVFNRYCKNNGVRNPWDNPSALGSRISNDRGLLKKGGWHLVQNERVAPYYQVRRGQRYWKFSKRVDLISR